MVKTRGREWGKNGMGKDVENYICKSYYITYFSYMFLPFLAPGCPYERDDETTIYDLRTTWRDIY